MEKVARILGMFCMVWLLSVPIVASQVIVEKPAAVELVFAGSGGNLRLTRILADGFMREHPDVSIEVPESIGSRGGMSAAAEGAVAVGLVSRELKEEEKELGLAVTPYARTGVVFGAHSEVSETGITFEDIVAIYRGTLSSWKDGREIIVLTREPGDSSIESYREALPELEAGEYVVLTVSDTGCGMDEETMKNIFDPFFTTKEHGKGTGLGLSIIYGIVKSHGGHVSCRSGPGKGTSFKIHLPAIEPIEEPYREPAEESTPAGGTETVLLVDDESRILDLGAQILTDFGYSVVTATDGESALEIYRKERGGIDLVVLDLIMPGMGGRRLLRELYRMDPGARVVIASGYPENTSSEEAWGERSECLLISKPYETRQLLTAIRRVLDA